MSVWEAIVYRVIEITISSGQGSEKATRTFSAEGNNLEELMANAHGQLDTAIADVERATHHKATDQAVTGEPFSVISLMEQRSRRDAELRLEYEREKGKKANARAGRGRMPEGNRGEP